MNTQWKRIAARIFAVILGTVIPLYAPHFAPVASAIGKVVESELLSTESEAL